MDDKLGAKAVEKPSANVSIKKDVKLGIKKDATLVANDEAKHGVDMVEK